MNIPAFPGFDYINQDGKKNPEGMTLRDYFAAKAMQGLLAANTQTINALLEATKGSGSVSELAYHMADVMLKAREQ